MANNTEITEGSGKTIATDEVAGVNYQRVKLVDGTEDSTTSILAGGGVESGALRVTIASDSTGVLSIDDNSGSITVDGTVTANLSATDNAVLDAIQAGTDKIIAAPATEAKQDTINTSINTLLKPASTLAAVTAITNVVHVDDNGGALTVDGTVALGAGTAEIGKLAAGVAEIGNVKNSGTFAVQATAVGTVADDATTPGAPVMVGGKAVETDGTDPTSVSAEDDVAIFRTDRNRRLLVNTSHPNMGSATETHTSAQTDNELIAAPGANLSIYITDIIVSNGATAGTVLFEEDTASAKTVKIQKAYLGVNSGFTKAFNTPIRCTPNKNFGFTSADVTTHSVTVTYYIAP